MPAPRLIAIHFHMRDALVALASGTTPRHGMTARGMRQRGWMDEAGHITAAGQRVLDSRFSGYSIFGERGPSDDRYLEAVDQFQSACESAGRPFRFEMIHAMDHWRARLNPGCTSGASQKGFHA